MKKPILGLLLGGLLGTIDGASTILFHPGDAAIRADILLITLMGTFKGLVTGIVIGLAARRLRSLVVAIPLGLLVGLALAAPLAYWVGEYMLEILLPGAAMGIILGYATQRYGVPARS